MNYAHVLEAERDARQMERHSCIGNDEVLNENIDTDDDDPRALAADCYRDQAIDDRITGDADVIGRRHND